MQDDCEEEKRKKTRKAFWTSRALVLCACALLVYSFVVSSDVAATVISKDTKDEITHPTPRLVFMVIDAFRLSFLTAPDSPMSFTRSSIQSSSATLFDAYARMPTVTLPRITAYITGTVPSFGTILTNLATNEIKTDNWISRLNVNRKRVHFFGDDTWIKLLPGQFDKSEGVTSFFVNDFTEVDNNVTRHLDEELSSEDWDALILHYLGLDHVGHSLGGTSPKIKEKLSEMDGIVSKIHTELSKTNEETYMIVCGDHGMTAAGSHGGASTEETRVPVVVWKVNGDEQDRKRSTRQSMDKPRRIEQIDISSTIFDIFGMKVPRDSYGISLAGSFQSDGLKSLKDQHNHFKRLVRGKHLSASDVCEEADCEFTSPFIQSTLEKWFKEVQEELIGTAAEVPNGSLAVCVTILILAAFLSSTIWIANSHLYNLALFGVNLICFASSLIEEEHEIWFFLTSTVIVYQIVWNFINWKKRSKNEVQLTAAICLAVLHRIASGFTQSTRRRWSMDRTLLPPAVFSERYDLSVDDLNTFLGDHSLTTILLSGILWVVPFTPSRLQLVLPLVSHLLRLFKLTRLDAYYLALSRLSIVLVSILSGSSTHGILSLLLTVVPSSQLLLVFIIYQIGSLSSKLNLSQSETVIFYMSSFFYTGNSNSLSTLSLTAGYVGLLDYYPVLVGFQLFIYTFAGPIAFLCGRESKNLSLHFTFRISCLSTSLVCLFIFQHHLFVWSVYTPKVVYDMAHVVFYLIADIQ